MGGWWAVHENCPYVKYRHYYLDRKTKCTHTQQKILIRDGGGRVMKVVPMSNIATKTKCACAHTHKCFYLKSEFCFKHFIFLT